MDFEINLLPWRALKRQQEKKAWLILGLTVVFVGFFVVFFSYYYVESLIKLQERKNNRLQEKLVIFSREIQKIDHLIVRQKTLISDIHRMEKLQKNRSLIVHFFDELAKIVPDDIYLTYAQGVGQQIKVVGVSESNHAVSAMMGNIERNAWFHQLQLTEIKKMKLPLSGVRHEFKLSFMVKEKK